MPRSLHWPAPSCLLHPRWLLLRGSAISPRATSRPAGPLRQLGLTGSSPRASGLPQPRRQGPRHLSGEAAAAGRGLAAPLTPEEKREERERVSSSPPLIKTERSLSRSVSAPRSPSSGYHRRSLKRLSPVEPVPGLSPPPGPSQGTSPPSRWGSCPNPEGARAAAPPRSQPDAAPARSSATLR